MNFGNVSLSASWQEGFVIFWKRHDYLRCCVKYHAVQRQQINLIFHIPGLFLKILSFKLHCLCSYNAKKQKRCIKCSASDRQNFCYEQCTYCPSISFTVYRSKLPKHRHETASLQGNRRYCFHWFNFNSVRVAFRIFLMNGTQAGPRTWWGVVFNKK